MLSSSTILRYVATALFLSLCSLVSASIPQSYQHTNLLRTIDLTKPYIRDSTALILENISNSTQNEYFLGIPTDLVPALSYLEVREKKPGSTNLFPVEPASQDHPFLKLYKVELPPMVPAEKISLVISSAYVDSLLAYPEVVAQDAKQYLVYTGEKYATSLYNTLKQKTKIKLKGEIEDYTKGTTNTDGETDPSKSGSVLTYGPYGELAPTSTSDKIRIHYEYTSPIPFVEHLQRDIEVSHWGNNVAVEEHYTLTNHAAKLKGLFSRLQYTRNSYTSPPTHAITRLTIPLKNGARNPYYIDTIGNVSTSRFRPARGSMDSHLEIMPRFPVYGGWNYTFKLGWNVDLEKVERHSGAERVLKVPFLEGPENIQYKKFDFNIILPEGSRNVRVYTPQPALKETRYMHHTFLDSLGRTAVKLSFENVVDEKRGKEVVIIYEYPPFAGLRKVVIVALGVFVVFATRIVGGWVLK